MSSKVNSKDTFDGTRFCNAASRSASLTSSQKSLSEYEIHTTTLYSPRLLPHTLSTYFKNFFFPPSYCLPTKLMALNLRYILREIILSGRKKRKTTWFLAMQEKREFILKCSKLSNLSNCLLLFPRFFSRLHSTWKDLLKDLLNDFQMSNAAKLLGQELRVAQRGCRADRYRWASNWLPLFPFFPVFFFGLGLYRVIID